MREGEPGDRLYVVQSGELNVTGTDQGAGAVRALSKMDYFGEIALLHAIPRTATVRARGAVELFSLGRADLQELLRRSSALQLVMEQRMQGYVTRVRLGGHV